MIKNQQIQKDSYKNLSLANLKNEKWKPFPGFEKLYQISSYGRVKSLNRNTASKKKPSEIGAKIMKSVLRKIKNKSTETHLYMLGVNLSKESEKHYFSIGRIVYYCFVKKFDLNDTSKLVSYKDHNGRNCHFSNLILTDAKNLKLLSLKRGRSTLSSLTKKVTCFNGNGEPIKHYVSIAQAARKTKFQQSLIAQVINGDMTMYKGFFWKEGHITTKLNLNKIKNQSKDEIIINENLKERLGIKRVDKLNPPALLNLSVKSMDGEKWKDVPGYENLYQLSNYGRIKSLKKISQGKSKKWMPEKIIGLVFDMRIKGKDKQHVGSPIMTLSKDNIKTTYSVSRYVYYLFVKKFDLHSKELRIYYKDGNTTNNACDNLELKNASWSLNTKKKAKKK